MIGNPDKDLAASAEYQRQAAEMRKALPRIPPKHLANGCYARADAIEAHWEAEKAETQRLRLRCEALAILLYGPAPERTRERIQAELEACESAVTALRDELASLVAVGTNEG